MLDDEGATRATKNLANTSMTSLRFSNSNRSRNKSRLRTSGRSTRVKKYLGMLDTSFSSLSDVPEDEEMSFSSISTNSVNLSAPKKVVLVEIPEDGLPRSKPETNKSKESQSQQYKSESLNELESDTDFDDIDNYMLSVFMNDDSSVYSKGTASTSSTSSTVSTRSRHRGAHINRSAAAVEPRVSGWLESMKRSSSAFFVNGGWSANDGWQISKSKEWDATPEEGWDQPSPLFDQVVSERIEI